MKKILFVTGTRADFGKLKPLIQAAGSFADIQSDIFVTGMHLLKRYGSTWEEVGWANLAPVHPFLNQSPGDTMDVVLSKTVSGLSDYVKENRPDLIVVHGDRVEALAGAIVGSLSNIHVAHVEGGELSGTVDEVLRHAISKLSHWHFPSNSEARERLVQLGEDPESIFVIGSPDVDLMLSGDLPPLDEALSHYGLDFTEFGILIFHPVTTEVDRLADHTRALMDAIVESGDSVVVVESNNDLGSGIIRDIYSEYLSSKNLRFFPSMRFEYFLAMLKSAKYIVGNSSAGVREAPYFGVPAINLGTRQLNRVTSSMVLDIPLDKLEILNAISYAKTMPRVVEKNFGDGHSAEKFKEILAADYFWSRTLQKQFISVRVQDEGA